MKWLRPALIASLAGILASMMGVGMPAMTVILLLGMICAWTMPEARP